MERPLSPFMAKEMLYEFSENQLDSQRKKLVQEAIKKQVELKEELKKIQQSKIYLEKLSQLNISESVYEQVKSPATYSEVLMDKVHHKKWPLSLKLSVEAFLALAGVFFVFMLIPWDSLKSIKWVEQSSHILFEVDKNIGKREKEREKTFQNNSSDILQNKNQEKSQQKQVISSDLSVIYSNQTQKSNSGEIKAISPSEQAKGEDTSSKATLEKKSGAGAVTSIGADELIDLSQSRGFLYRGILYVQNSQEVSLKLKNKILELGGKKAGQVDLGWNRGKGKYFHFTLPEEKYLGLVDEMKKEGQLKFQKERHERKMPEGLVRVIFNIEEKPNSTAKDL